MFQIIEKNLYHFQSKNSKNILYFKAHGTLLMIISFIHYTTG